MKGISAIIATLLLLVITMGLAVTAYFYINNLIVGKTSKVISLLDASCAGSTLVAVISNDGTTDIATSELRVLLDGTPQNPTFDPTDSIPTRSTAVITIGSVTSGTHDLLIVSPSSPIRQTVIC